MSNDKQINIGDDVTLWTGEGAKLVGVLNDGTLLVMVPGEPCVWHMDPAHVSAAD